ncbi:hypothetical protein E5F05_06285 [Deinococcus metallilatus]|uniref:DUF2381 family protein n=1 Tax=Deinococcus metallilatus TaxID=1211322 RepID=A0AAJ5F5W5_9DEIO|nr:hypothetical protein [Deinococcus metallilatus]MBB5294552.1 hypothetical protein [Deinococcus metallilatus]QBY07595.1 hypothetical protein E5F05_06285 [Deinococcus metallilatus]RXJ14011.1 hypothetical protein ERJ73_05120 [Deinococcus metallilatus]TLK29976.1 hypothetical protein FCS05_05435 [Deinococcus metallilatus]GMA15765.1 hypothetical protein GCM10025871_20960 [Deinococcus metallilatus]
MKPLLLTALLLAAPAATAQTSIPAIPATPPPSTAAPRAAPGTAATTTLRLTAQPGTTVELTANVKTQLTLEDVQVTKPGGQPASAAEVARLRADIQKGLSSGAAAVPSIRTLYKVQDRAADGTVTLLTSVVTSVPGQPPISLRLTQTVAPDGRTRITRVESDNPTVQAALQALPPDVLQAQANQGGNLTDLYGQTFTVGQPRTQTRTVDAQALLGSMFGAMAASMGGGNPFSNLKATPLTVRTTITYRGMNAGGQRVFDTSSTAGAWTIELGDQTEPMHLKLELLDLTESGQSLYRPDGLPAGQTGTQTMRMRLTMTEPDGSQTQMLLRLNQNVSMQGR